MTAKKIAFLTGKRGGMDAMKMTLASLDKLVACLDLELVPRRKGR